MDNEDPPSSSQHSHSKEPQLISHDHPSSSTLSKSQPVKETRAMKRFRKIDETFSLFGESMSSKERVCPLIEPPYEVIKSPLLAHQKEGLRWLVERENSNDLPPFWEEREGKFVNLLTDYRIDNRPEPLRSGILADDSGLGKTLTLLSLIALDKGRDFGNGDVGKKSKKKGSGSQKRPKIEDVVVCDGLVTDATLVVCPPSALSTWITQLEQHTVSGSLRTCIYHGPGDANELKMNDLVLTAYATLSSEDNFDESPLKKLEWRRIILDDAHTIKNFSVQQTKAVISLNASRRWAVTGAPIHNGLMDLFSLMEFLHFEPFSTRSYWLNLVQQPINMNVESGFSRLQILLAALSLRRTKGTELAGLLLPPKIIDIHCVKLNSEERELYDRLHEIASNSISSCVARDQILRYYSTLLNLVLLLCQVCSDMAFCPEDIRLLSPSNNIRDISEEPKLVEKLDEKLKAVENLGCPICLSPSMDVVITLCAHIFCRTCILNVLQYGQSCPLCRHLLKESDLFSVPPQSTRNDSSAPSSSSSSIARPSSKTLALIKLLEESRDQNPAVKSIVFSQFNKMLSLLQEHLKVAGFKTLCLDGLTDAKASAEVIDRFQSGGRDGPTVLLASLKASTTGINLTAASRVYFMDPWCNSDVEEQAIDCVHRMGQKEAVKIVKFIAQDTVEEKMLKEPEEMKEITETIFRNGTPGCFMSINDIRFFMNMNKIG